MSAYNKFLSDNYILMIVDIAYKGLKYVVVFGIIYFVVKYTAGNEMKDIDVALVASVLTLLLCVLENMVFANQTSYDRCNTTNNVQENMGGIQNNLRGLKAPGNLNVSGSMLSNVSNNNGVPIVKTIDNIKVSGANLIGNQTNVSTSPSSINQSDMSSDISSTISSDATSDVASNASSNESSNMSPNNITFIRKNSSPNPSSPNPILSDPSSPHDQTSQTPIPSSQTNMFIGTDFQLHPATENKFDGQIDSLYDEKNTEQNNMNNNDTDSKNIVVDDLINSKIAEQNLLRQTTIDKRSKIKVPQTGNFIRPDNAIADVTPTAVTVSSFDSNSGSGKKIDIDIKPSIEKGTGGLKVPSQPSIMNRVSPSGKPLKWYEQAFNPRQYSYAENLDQIAVSGGRTRNDILTNEMIYSDFNRLPPSFNDNDFEYGYSFLPPKDWYPLPPYPPVCVSSCKTTPPVGIYTDNTTMNLKEWHETQKFTPPESINTEFITNELNSKE
jgi:hypothetical protein